MARNISPARERSLVRWRAGLGLAALVVPLALFALIERQARRLDALATDGKRVDARVTAVSQDGRTTSYAYPIEGREYAWSAERSELPLAVGAAFVAVYLPADPSLSGPWADRARAAEQAAESRAFAWKLALGLGLVLLAFAALAQQDLKRLRSGAPSELVDPGAYKRRLVRTALLILAIAALISGLHARQAHAQEESLLPALLGFFVVLGIAASMFAFVLRQGPWRAQERAARILRWAAPLAGGIALLRLLVALLGE